MSLMKGAFVVFQTPAPVPTDLIMFQFNSETLVRKLRTEVGDERVERAVARVAERAIDPYAAVDELLAE